MFRKIRRFLALSILLFQMVPLCAGCYSSKELVNDPEPSMLRGDRTKSASERTSEERPQPWDEDKRRFPEDGLNLDGYQEMKLKEHVEEHNRHSLTMESFSHPACQALPMSDRKACPMVVIPWFNQREVPGGIALDARIEGEISRSLRWMILCHMAFGRAVGGGSSCPLHVSSVRASIEQHRDHLTLILTTPDGYQVSTLRDRASKLLR